MLQAWRTMRWNLAATLSTVACGSQIPCTAGSLGTGSCFLAKFRTIAGIPLTLKARLRFDVHTRFPSKPSPSGTLTTDNDKA